MTADKKSELLQRWYEYVNPANKTYQEWLQDELETAEDALKAALADRERLQFMISVMNCWDMFGDFTEAYVEGFSTSRERADDAEWVAMIDRARNAKVTA